MKAAITQCLEECYSLGRIHGLKETETGSGNTFIALTDTGRYFIKLNERVDFIKANEKASKILLEKGFAASTVVPSKDGLLSKSHMTVYTFIEGVSFKRIPDSSLPPVIEYIKSYLKQLAILPPGAIFLEKSSPWDRAKSLSYLTQELPYMVAEKGFPNEIKETVQWASKRLLAYVPSLSDLRKQLIHSDLGPDNILFNETSVQAIVDFTPDINSPWFAYCQFIYWNELWFTREISTERLNLNYKTFKTEEHSVSEELFYAFLLYTALYRLAGALPKEPSEAALVYKKLKPRIELARGVAALVKP